MVSSRNTQVIHVSLCRLRIMQCEFFFWLYRQNTFHGTKKEGSILEENLGCSDINKGSHIM